MFEALFCSITRVAANRSEVISLSPVPLLPLVHITTAATVPNSLTHLASAPPHPPSQSSGWGVIAMALLGAVVNISIQFLVFSSQGVARQPLYGIRRRECGENAVVPEKIQADVH
jgi:hypothetical protein